MKRWIVAVAGAGALSLALVGTVSAGATTKPAGGAARAVKPHTTPTLTLSKGANLLNNTIITVSGSGFGPSDGVIFTECNGDGAGPGPFSGSCFIAGAVTVKASPTGTFSHTFKVRDAAMSSGHSGVSCPQNYLQAEHAVECFIGAEDSTTDTFALIPILFAAPPLKATVTKSTVVKGQQTYSVKINETGDYQGAKPPTNNGGFLIIGETASGNRTCQGTTNGKTWTTPGWPPCTKFLGEPVDITRNKVKVALFRVNAATGGTFSYTFPHLTKGTYTIGALGLVSGESLSTTVTVP